MRTVSDIRQNLVSGRQFSGCIWWI